MPSSSNCAIPSCTGGWSWAVYKVGYSASGQLPALTLPWGIFSLPARHPVSHSRAGLPWLRSSLAFLRQRWRHTVPAAAKGPSGDSQSHRPCETPILWCPPSGGWAECRAEPGLCPDGARQRSRSQRSPARTGTNTHTSAPLRRLQEPAVIILLNPLWRF